MSALSQNTKQSYVAVRFKYGDPASPTYSRYTDFPSSIVGPDGSLYTSLVQLSVSEVHLSGTFQETPMKIKMGLGSVGSFSDQISSGEPHSKVDVDVWEVIDPDPSALPNTVVHLFEGTLEIAVRSADGHSQIIELECVNTKGKLEVPVGLLVMPGCVWTFAGRGCQKSTVGLLDTGGTLTAKDPTDPMIVTITGLGVQTGRYWHRGYIEVDGLRIGIRDWVSTDATTFCMVQEPPDRWVGVSVSAFPGCDKALDTCINRWSNEEHFGGFGFSIPAYHPVIEDGAP